MKLSIVTPSYNQGKFLGDTIRSVIASTRPPDEYFVIDGGSNDGSVDTIREYEGFITTWVSEPDQGQADAINKGFRLCNGDIIGWLNSDDMVLPGTFDRILKVFEHNPNAAIVYGDVFSIDEIGETINLQRFRQLRLPDLMAFNIISQPGVFFRRGALQAAGLLDESYHYLLDHHLWLRLAQQGEMVYIPEPFAAARYHPAAKNVAYTRHFGQEAFRMMAWMRDDPRLGSLFAKHKRKIESGAYRLDGYYQMEGGQFWQGLACYGRAIIIRPVVLALEWKHLLYAVLGIAGLQRAKELYKQARKKKYGQPTQQ